MLHTLSLPSFPSSFLSSSAFLYDFLLWTESCAPKYIYWSSNPQYLRMWLYLKIRSLRRELRLKRPSGSGLNLIGWCHLGRGRTPPCPRRSTPTKERLCEKTARRHLLLIQGERLVLPAPGSWPFSLLSYDKKKKILLFKPPTLWYICTYLFFIHYLFVYRAALAHVGKEKFSFYLLGSMAGSKKETDPVSFRN